MCRRKWRDVCVRRCPTSITLSFYIVRVPPCSFLLPLKKNLSNVGEAAGFISCFDFAWLSSCRPACVCARPKNLQPQLQFAFLARAQQQRIPLHAAAIRGIDFEPDSNCSHLLHPSSCRKNYLKLVTTILYNGTTVLYSICSVDIIQLQIFKTDK